MKWIPLSHHLLIGSGRLFAGFIACQLSYAVIGQRIDKNGALREPFFLIPISTVLLLGSSVSLAGARGGTADAGAMIIALPLLVVPVPPQSSSAVVSIS